MQSHKGPNREADISIPRPPFPAEAQRVPEKRQAPLRVLLVHGSPTVRRLLRLVLEGEAEFQVAAIARTGLDALKIIKIRLPDVLILGDRDAVLDGDLLKQHLRERASTLHVVPCASLSEGDATLALQHLLQRKGETERRDVQPAPLAREAACWIAELRATLRTIAGAQLAVMPPEPRLSGADEVTRRPQKAATPGSAGHARHAGTPSPKAAAWVPKTIPRVLTIGCSTGGPAALTEILPLIPADFSMPVLIVQHMPPHFTALLADRLARSTKIPVMEAVNGMEVKPGVILIAPGDFHMKAVRKKNHVEIELTREPHENSCRPAVDVLFRSVAEAYNGAAVAAVLTGMGQDGLRGARALKEAGAAIVVQDRATSVVWGMPGAVAEAGLADLVLPLAQIVPEAMRLL